MGIKNAHIYTYAVQNLSIDQLYILVADRLKCKANNNRLPRVDIDVSWIVKRYAVGNVDCRIRYLLKLSSAFTDAGFSVNLVCDGIKRHHSKRATIHRHSQVQQKKIELIVKRSQMMMLSERRQTTDSIVEKNDIQQTEKQIQSKIKSIENFLQRSEFDFGENFFETLQSAISYLENNNSITSSLALYQADSVMASNIINNSSDILLTIDSDQAALLGPDCLCIKNFKVKYEKQKIKLESIEIFCADKIMIQQICDTLKIPNDSKNIINATYPVFENIKCPRLRSIIAVSLGCDVSLSSIITPAQMLLFIKSTQFAEVEASDAYYATKKFMVDCWLKKKSSKSKKEDIVSEVEVDIKKFNEMIDVFVDALLYEPTNTVLSTNNNTIVGSLTYIHYSPTKTLHQYIADFQNVTPTVVDCSEDLPLCEGNGTINHMFMKAEGHCFCSTCKKIICMHCIFQQQKGEPHYCYNCYLPSMSVGNKQVNNNFSTTTELREKLRELGINTKATDNASDLLEIYEDAIDNTMYSENVLLEKIKTPTESPEYLPILVSNKVSSFDFKTGGSFITDSRLSSNTIFALIRIIASLVTMFKNKNNQQYTEKTYRLVPQIIVDFAEGSRVSEGFRLVMRCIRHALDSQTETLLGASGHIVLNNTRPCFMIHHRVRASMKTNTYDVVVCFDDNNISACSCTYKTGGEKKQKVLCVHILPVIYQFSLLLFDGMADSILVELSNHWKTIVSNLVSNDNNQTTLKEVRKNIVTIMAASQQLAPDTEQDATIEQILERFSVGTEQSKMSTQPPKDQRLLGPLNKLDLRSIQKKAGQKIKQTNNNSVSVSNNTEHNQPTQSKQMFDKNTYRQLIKCIAATTIIFGESTAIDCIGYKVLEERATPLTIDEPGNIIVHKQQINTLVKLANEKYRRLKNNQNNQQDDLPFGECNDDEDSDDNIITKCIKIEDENNEELPPPPIKHRRTCCACKTTSTSDPLSTFSAVPFTKRCINSSDSNKKRISYYKAQHQRKEWLRILGLRGDIRPTLKICNNHLIESRIVEFKYINVSGETVVTSAKMNVPVDPTLPPNKTRLQNQTRQPAKIKNNRMPRPQQQVPKKKVVSYKVCNFANCKIKTTKETRFLRIPKAPTYPTNKEVTKKRNMSIMRYNIKKYLRRICLRRIGLRTNDTRNNLRICSCHEIETVTKEVRYLDYNNKNQSIKVKMYLPASQGASSQEQSTNRQNKGIGRDRWINQQLINNNNMARNNGTENELLLLSQVLEAAEGNVEQINPIVAINAGIQINKKPQQIKAVIPKRILEENNQQQKVIIRMNDLNNENIKVTTGFPSLVSMLTFIMILCNGDFMQVRTTITRLTWLEEWLCYFEAIWCKNSTRWVDLEIRFKIASHSVRCIFDHKLTIHINCVLSWPRFASYDEDISLRKQDKWDEYYKDKRVIMWDNTNVPFAFKPTQADSQRNTYSLYYAGNVAKGAIFIQPCGWMGTYDLWVGAVSDSDYMERSGILEYQQTFVTQCDPINNTVPFTIILDKGYRITSVAWRVGNQLTLQPSFARSDHKFTSYETIRSAAVASDRAANERAVRLSKMCGYVRTGLRQNESTSRISKVWIAWGFQCNFIYKPVL